MYLQVSDFLVLRLDRVKVTPSSDYQALIGCDVLNGDGQVLGKSVIDLEGKVSWRILRDNSMHFS